MNQVNELLCKLLIDLGLPGDAADTAEFHGMDPVVNIPYKVATAAQAAIAASGVAAALLYEAASGRRQRVTIDAPEAVAAMRSYRYFGIAGEKPADNGDPLTGFYQTSDQRWIYVHCNFFNLKKANLAVIGAADNTQAMERAIAGWSGEDLEEKLFQGGAVAPWSAARMSGS